MAAKAVLKSAAVGLAAGALLYLVGDTASDVLTYRSLHAAAMQLVAQDEELQQLVGVPYTSGAWYNATLGFSHRAKVAHCTFQLQGSRRVTDVAVKAGRQAGPSSTILYNLAGPGTWQVMSCQAMVPSGGGLVQPRSLLPEHQEEAAAAAAAAAAGQLVGAAGAAAAAAAAAGCQPCQQQQRGGGAAAEALPPGGQRAQRGWRWWPRAWTRGSGSGSSGAASREAAAGS